MGRLSDHIEARRESGPVAFPAADRSVLSLHWTPGHSALWLAGVDATPAQGAAQLYFPPSPEPLPCTELFDQCWFLTSLSTSSLSFQFLCENYRTHSIHCPLKRQPQDLWLTVSPLGETPGGNLSLFHAFMFSITVSKLQVSSSSSEDSSSQFIHQVSVFHSGGYILLLLTGGMTLSPLGTIRPPSLEDGLLVLFGLVFIPHP